MSNLKLQKVLYFVQAEFLVNKNEPCFHEDIEAWNFGPVVPEVYHQYKIFGSSNIPGNDLFDENLINYTDRLLINNLVDTCAKYSATELVDITHGQAPWINNYRKHYSNIISKEEIRRYFMED